MDSLVVNIRIEVDPNVDDKLEAWAHQEKRSKREHVAYLVQELLACYEQAPHILHLLTLGRMSGALPALHLQVLPPPVPTLTPAA